MASRSLIRGWQTNDATLEGGLTGAGATIDATSQITGTYSLKIVAASGTATYGGFNGTLGIGDYVRFRIKVTVRPSTTARVIQGAITLNTLNLRLNPNGTIAVYVNTTLIGTSTTALTDTSRIYLVEARSLAGTGVDALKIDGAVEVTGNIPSSSAANEAIGATDTVADTYTAFFGDYAGDTADFPGDGRVVLSLPISDNARAAKWTGGAGGTTNLFAAVDNTPPTGTASETDSTQIEHSGGGAGNEDYDADMTTYSSLGVGASDTVNAVQALFAHGEDIATGTKTLTFGVKSNPAGSFESNFSAGNDAGAVGTYPTTWVVKRGTIINNPSVTVANSPVMTARRPGTESRVASVCFMGMYVDYTPGATTKSPPPWYGTHRPQHRTPKRRYV